MKNVELQEHICDDGAVIVVPVGSSDRARMRFDPDIPLIEGLVLDHVEVALGDTIELIDRFRGNIVYNTATDAVTMVRPSSIDSPSLVNTSMVRFLASVALYESFHNLVLSVPRNPEMIERLTREGAGHLVAIDPTAGDFENGWWPTLLMEVRRLI